MPDDHPPLPVDMEQKPQFEDYTVEVRNRFKGVYLIECLMNYGWRFVTLYRRQGVVGGHLALLLRQKQAIFRLQLKKVRKTTRPLSYDINQIPYDFTVEMKNRFKGLCLVA